jgi:hypothetical protein
VRIVLKRRLSEIRVIAIVLLLLGVVTSQSDRLQKTHSPAPSSTDDTKAIASKSSPEETIFGLLLVLTAVTISSCASVFTEWSFKRKDASSSFLWQNAQLYVFGILFNGFGVLVESSEIASRGFFDGYNNWTIATILVNCVAGISVGFILKFLDNIAVVYAHAVAMMLTMLVSMVFFRFSPSLEFVCGLGVLLVSMYLYHHKVGGAHAAHAAASPGGSTTMTCSSCSSSPSSSSSPSINMASAALSLSVPGLHTLKKQQYEKLPLDLEVGGRRRASSESSESDD